MMMTQMPVVMTPHVATPAMFQHSMPPWVTQTPEASPMIWGCAPQGDCYNVYAPASTVPNPNGISKEFLRSVCEPYFEQMLMAVSQAVQVQAQNQQALLCQNKHMVPSMQTQQGVPLEEPSTSTEGSECGAFSAIFTPTTEEEHHAKNGARSFMCGADAFSKTTPAESTLAESDDAELHRQDLESDSRSESVPEQSVMVCRHWKSKGWCRMEENCKFLHPEQKRGVGFVNGAKAAGTTGSGSAEISSCPDQNNDPADQLAPISADGKKKPSKKRKNKGKSAGPKDEIAIPGRAMPEQLTGYPALS